MAMFGCIEPSRTTVDARVTADVPDTTDTIETPDISVDDSTERDVVGVVCGSDPTDCEDLEGGTDCSGWECVDSRCKLVAINEGGACEDDSLCTIGDACMAGVCVPGTGEPDCSDLEATNECQVVGCVPEKGCKVIGVDAGTVCDNGSLPAVGSCVAGGFVPPDACDGQGNCVDRPAGATGTPGVTRVDGDWFLVYNSYGRDVLASTTRAVVDVDANGNTFNIRGVQEAGPIPLGLSSPGFLCADSNGLMDLRLNTVVGFTGRHLDGKLGLITSPLTEGVALLLRADQGTPDLVDGTYKFVRARYDSVLNKPVIWRGDITFDHGCIQSGVIGTDLGGGANQVFERQLQVCMTATTDVADDAGLYASFVSYHEQGTSTSRSSLYRGAIGPDGDVLLMVEELANGSAAARQPKYGVIIMFREGATPIDAAALAGDWAYSFQGSTPNAAIRRDFGTLTWDANGQISTGSLRTFDGTKQVTGGWYYIDPAGGKMSQRLIMDSEVYQAGYVAPSGRFIVGWNVSKPQSDSPGLINDLPYLGTLLLMLKP